VENEKDEGRSHLVSSSVSDLWLTLTLEFELVTQALWTDPGDQSGWIYHRWLIGTSMFPVAPFLDRMTLTTDPPDRVLKREINNIRELHDTEPDSKCTSLVTHLYPSRGLPCLACHRDRLSPFTSPDGIIANIKGAY
jgi:hypothetical protein